MPDITLLMRYPTGHAAAKKSRGRFIPTPAKWRVANPRQGDFAKPDCGN